MMSRRALNTSTIDSPAIRTRQPRPVAPQPTGEMIRLAQEAFLANKEANAATSRCKAKQKELSKAMSKAGIDAFEFMGPVPTGGEVAARAAIEPFDCDVISVEILRGLVDDATFMRIVKASQTAVKDEAGEYVCNKALVTETRPPELKIKEVK
jgi:hypothetical protein